MTRRTARLILRPFTPADVDAVWAYQADPRVARHLRWEPRTRAQVANAVDQMARETRLANEGDCLTLAATLADTGAVVGQVELVWLSREHRQGEIGYIFAPAFHGRGLATEAAAEVLRIGFEEMGLHRVVGRCTDRNTASARLLERLGMRREAHYRDAALVKGEWRDELLYAILQAEWRARRR